MAGGVAQDYPFRDKITVMPDESRGGDVDKILADEKALQDRKQALVAELLKQKEAAIKEFDDKLAKLGYEANSSGKQRRSHHRKQASAPDTAAKPKAKA
jgi:hypothetical protein